MIFQNVFLQHQGDSSDYVSEHLGVKLTKLVWLFLRLGTPGIFKTWFVYAKPLFPVSALLSGHWFYNSLVPFSPTFWLFFSILKVAVLFMASYLQQI